MNAHLLFTLSCTVISCTRPSVFSLSHACIYTCIFYIGLLMIDKFKQKYACLSFCRQSMCMTIFIHLLAAIKLESPQNLNLTANMHVEKQGRFIINIQFLYFHDSKSISFKANPNPIKNFRFCIQFRSLHTIVLKSNMHLHN
jgi:hypothetical protein